jgi:hypothetical protein
MKTGDGRGGIDLDFTEGSREGCFDLTDGTGAQQKRVVMVMKRDCHDGQEKAEQRKKNNFFDQGMMHRLMAPCRLYEAGRSYHYSERFVKGINWGQ